MATKRRNALRRSGEASKPLAVQYPESDFDRFVRAKLIEVEVAQAEHEQKWGIGRVTTLVPTEFREKFYAQQERIWSARKSQDASRFGSACDGMIRAFKAMSDWAIKQGIEPITSVQAIEADTHLGTMVIVRNEIDAEQYLALRKDVIQVWTVDEIAELLKAGIGNAMWELKAQIPVRGFVAAVQQTKDNPQEGQQKAAGEAVGLQEDRTRPSAKPAASGGDSGFEDLENDIDLDTPVNFPKMFQAPAEAKTR